MIRCKRQGGVRNFFVQLPSGLIEIYMKDDIKTLVDFEGWLKSCLHRWSVTKTGYAESNSFGKRIRLHNMMLDTLYVDHINQDKLDNRLCNLRKCNHALNNANRPGSRGTSSKWKGVSKIKRSEIPTWEVKISINNKAKSLGHYRDEGVAAMVYNEAALERFGEFAVLNVSDLNFEATNGGNDE